MTGARRAAFEVLLATARGALASDRLDRARAGLDARDAALATELVYGVLRRRAQLDWLLRSRLKREPASLDLEVRVALELGAYQLRFLERVPAHAAVSESVDLAKTYGHSKASGLVNAVLRRLPDLPKTWPDDPTRLSMPAWLLDRWNRRWGAPAAEAIASAALAPPETYVRVPPDCPVPEGCESTQVPGCYRVSPSAAPPGYRQQSIGSQAIVELLEMRPRDTFLDLCAAPGNKTLQAMEKHPALAVACDASWRRLSSFEAPNASKMLLDAASRLPFRPVFDRILVDAPCSGTGTLARNPEIRWRLRPEDLARHAARQKAILAHALECLKPGGRLVYSTCSLESEENEEVVNQVAAGRVERFVTWLPGRDPGDGFQAAVIT